MIPDDDDLAALTDLACRLANAAAAASLPHFRSRALGTANKGAPGRGFDPVTVADRAAEAAIRAILAAERPDDGILGEEEAPVEGSSGLTWVIDPIDGTRAFISGMPTWGILIALDDGTAGRIGIIDQPHIGERFIGVNAARGRSASLTFRGDTRPIATRPCAALSQAMLYSTTPGLFQGRELEGFRELEGRVRLSRYGTDCYAYALIAAGHVDLVVESGLNAYDIAAPAALIRAAGGVVTDWQGNDCRWGGRVVAAGDPAVHAEALALLGGYA